jgi:hypothetical protein
MTNKTPFESTGKWTFHLQQAQNLQFRIVSEQEAGAQIVIEGHDISSLLDYLYDNRELIYKATHDGEGQHLETREAFEHHTAPTPEKRAVEPIFYIDDGDGHRHALPG